MKHFLDLKVSSSNEIRFCFWKFRFMHARKSIKNGDGGKVFFKTTFADNLIDELSKFVLNFK